MTPLEWLKFGVEVAAICYAAFKLAGGVSSVGRELADFRRSVENEMKQLRHELDALRQEVRMGASATQDVLVEHTGRIANIEGRLSK